jgi:hypothetical protein
VDGLQLTGPDGGRVPLEPIPGLEGGVFAQLRSTGALGERMRFSVLRNGRRIAATLWLGRHDKPRPFGRYAVDGRRIRVWWTSHDFPVGAVRVRERTDRVRVRVTNRFPPTFDRAGFIIGRDDESALHCVDIRLRRPLGDRDVVDATGGGTARRREVAPPWPTGCHRAGHRVPGAR